MFHVLPDLTPRDSHSLWYTSSRSPAPLTASDPTSLDPGLPPVTSRRQNQAALERTALARLRADENYQERRKHNIASYGATWLKPPGIAKSLFQIREERREAEEHAEALRREQLAQQLAEAETGGGDDGMGGLEMGEDGVRMGLTGEEERDLDDEIPDADAEGFGFDGAESGDEEGSLSSGGEGDRDLDTAGGHAAVERRATREMRQMRATEDRVREMMARGQGEGPDIYGGEEDIDEEDQAQLLEEDDLVHAQHGAVAGDDLDMDMDADLDDDIPEAESGRYEHTDTEAEVSSDNDEQGPGLAASSVAQSSRFRGSLARSDGNSIDISSLLSRDGSSAIGSSPQLRRRP